MECHWNSFSPSLSLFFSVCILLSLLLWSAFFTQQGTWEPTSLVSQSSDSVTSEERILLLEISWVRTVLGDRSISNHYSQEDSSVYCDSLSFTFLNCKIGIILVPTRNCCCCKKQNNLDETMHIKHTLSVQKDYYLFWQLLIFYDLLNIETKPLYLIFYLYLNGTVFCSCQNSLIPTARLELC